MTGGREQIIVRVAPDGTISAETTGIKGAKCLDYINLLEDLLDAQTTKQRLHTRVQPDRDQQPRRGQQ